MWPHPTTEMTASSFKLRANAPEGQKAISYQLAMPIFLIRTPPVASSGFI